MEFWSYDSRRFFLFGVRLFFGLWLLHTGLVKWMLIGADAFVDNITTEFDATWSPHDLNVFLAWLILVAEPVLALFILSGKRPRVVWTLTALFLFLLVTGQTIIMVPEVINAWLYLVLALVCAALSDPEHRQYSKRT